MTRALRLAVFLVLGVIALGGVVACAAGVSAISAWVFVSLLALDMAWFYAAHFAQVLERNRRRTLRRLTEIEARQARHEATVTPEAMKHFNEVLQRVATDVAPMKSAFDSARNAQGLGRIFTREP